MKLYGATGVLIFRAALAIMFTTALFNAEGAGNSLSPAAPGAKVYFIAPADADRVQRTFTVKFGLKGMGVAPAAVNRENSGHHHLLIDVDELPDLTKPLPANAHIKHFGKGQTETEITLSPGRHTLQLVLGNYLHIPHNPPLISNKITLTVVD